jgi:DNA polymerase III subunit gamma/tau
MSHELFKKYRPKTLAKVIGQASAVKTLTEYVKAKRIPHAMIFTGPSGCGKTTLARIMKTEVNCGDHDFTELNCADFRGIDMVREIRSRINLGSLEGKGRSRVYLIDEAHMLTKDAQNALLKMVEEPPSHVYFMLATTDPGKLIKTIINRCTPIKVELLGNKDMKKLIEYVCAKEDKELTEDVTDKLMDCAEGSARKVLVLLDQIIALDDEEDQLEAIANPEAERQAIEIARALLNPKTTWYDMAKLLKSVDEDPESLRWMVLGYASAILLGGKANTRAFQMIEAFGENFYDTKRAGLIAACYELVVVLRP